MGRRQPSSCRLDVIMLRDCPCFLVQSEEGVTVVFHFSQEEVWSVSPLLTWFGVSVSAVLCTVKFSYCGTPELNSTKCVCVCADPSAPPCDLACTTMSLNESEWKRKWWGERVEWINRQHGKSQKHVSCCMLTLISWKTANNMKAFLSGYMNNYWYSS